MGRMRELLDFYLPQADEPDFRGFEWYYLWRLCHREEKTIVGTAGFEGVAYSPDGKSLVTLAIDRRNMRYTAEIVFRDATNWQTLSSQQYPAYGQQGMIAVSRDTNKVAIGLNSYGIKVFSFSDYKEHLLIGGLNLLRSVAISPSGKIIAAGLYDGKVQIFDAVTGKEIRTLVGHRQQINTIAFSPDEQLLVSGSFDQTIRLWEVSTGNEIRVLKQSGTTPNSATFTSDGNAVVAVCNRELKVWETVTGREIATRSIGAGRPVLAISPDGKILATADVQPVIRLWDTQTWQEKEAIKGHGNVIRSLAFRPDGTHLASGSLDQSTRIWNLSSNVKDVITLTDTEAQAGFSNALFTPNGQKIIAASSRAARASIWDSVSGRKLAELKGHTIPANISGSFFPLAVSSDSRLIATGSTDKRVKIWEVETGREISAISGLPFLPMTLAFSPSNRFLAIGTLGEVRIYDLTNSRETSKVKTPRGYVWALSFVSDDKTLMTANEGSILRFWDTTTGQELRNVKCNQDLLFAITVSANKKYFATGALDGTAAIWDVQTGNQVWLLKGHSSTVNGVSFSPDGKRLATSSNDRTVKLWDLTTGQELCTFKEAGGCSVNFSPDGKQLLAACGNKLTIWPAATEQEVREKKD